MKQYKKIILLVLMIIFIGCFDSGKPSNLEIKTQAMTKIVTKDSNKIYCFA